MKPIFFLMAILSVACAALQIDEDFAEVQDGRIASWRGKYEVASDARGSYLKVDRLNQGYAQRLFPPQTGKFEVRFRFLPIKANWAWCPSLSGNGKTPIKVVFQTNGMNVRLNQGFYNRATIRWLPGAWQQMRMVVDVEKQSYSVWVDEDQIAEDFGFSEEVQALDSMAVHYSIRDFHFKVLGD